MIPGGSVPAKTRPRLTPHGALVLTLFAALAVWWFWSDTHPPANEPVVPLADTIDAMPVDPAPTEAAVPTPPPAPEIIWQDGDFASRQPFYKRLMALGFNGNQVHGLIETLTPVYDFRKAHPRHRWSAGFRDETPVAFVLEVSPIEIYEVRDLDSSPVLHEREIETFVEKVVIRGEIEDSLYGALAHVDNAPALVASLASVFAWDIDFYQDPRQGDRFEMLVEKRHIVTDSGLEWLGWGRILSARYHGARGDHEAYRFTTSKNETGYFDSEGKSLIRDVLRSPLRVTRITSSFKRKRFHPILKRNKPHNGVDYGAPKGTPVMAVASGKVVRAGRWGGAGIAVVIQHKRSMETQYFHLSGIAKGVRRGSRVRQGQTIGYVGKTGLASGYHLHFGMKKKGRYVNPLTQKYQPGNPIPADDRDAFSVRMSVYRAAFAPVHDQPLLEPVVRLRGPLDQHARNHGPRVR